MPVSTLAWAKEKARQTINKDDSFFKRMLYFFELRIPADVGIEGATDFLFPLIIPPESYTMEEPFTLEATPTQGGGLYVEENGIVQRTIRLRGHTGFKPRNLNLPSSSGPVPNITAPVKKSYSRTLEKITVGALSGQRHFQYLQDSVFRTYADLKRDPTTAKDTYLIFHNPRDGEHWIVAPQKFTLERDKSNRVLYRYSIELLVLDAANASEESFSEDKNIFDAVKDKMRDVKQGIDRISGAINDLTAMVGAIKVYVNNIVKIIDAVNNIKTAGTNFLNGVTSLIELPYASQQTTCGLLDGAMESINNSMELGGSAQNFPPATLNKFRQVADGLEQLGQTPANWETTTEAVAVKLRDSQEARRKLTSVRKTEALAATPPATFSDLRSLGMQLTSGDVTSAEGEITIGSMIRKFQSARQIIVGQGDTLVNLAAKHMGDARLWQTIAVLNGLKPPYLDNQASMPLVSAISDGSGLSGIATGADESPFDGALGIGSKLLIPTNQKNSLQLPVLPVLGVQATEAAEVQFLGTDFELEAVTGIYGASRAQYDIAINQDLGSVDAKVVQGIDNLKQMLILRLLIEYGTDILYKKVGLRRIVGTRFMGVDLETARYRIQEAVSKDPRIASVQQITFAQFGNADQLDVDVTAVVRGFTESRKVTVTL